MASRSNLTIDFGLIPKVPTVTIGDRVWFDLNRDGLDNDAANGVSGATVVLRNALGVTLTTATNATGYYRFQSSADISMPNIVVAK
jgi:hypothetical protein